MIRPRTPAAVRQVDSPTYLFLNGPGERSLADVYARDVELEPATEVKALTS
jgi:hypothetical protein